MTFNMLWLVLTMHNLKTASYDTNTFFKAFNIVNYLFLSP